jgi:hypothetical protein
MILPDVWPYRTAKDPPPSQPLEYQGVAFYFSSASPSGKEDLKRNTFVSDKPRPETLVP